jgi:short-subunit dehydrogenase
MQNECWWITGASSGGEALAFEASRRGVRLILSGRDEAALARVADDCGTDRCLVLPFEATAFDALPEIASRATRWAGRIDCLVNNAGISQRSLAAETSLSVYQRIIDVDLLAPIALTQALLPHLIAQGGGRMIAVSSVAGLVGAPLRSAYSAAKHGLVGYCDSLRCETAHLGIKVHVVAPGSIKTNVSRNALLADGSARGESDAAIENGLPAPDAAKAILGAVLEGQREIILATGFEAHISALRRSDPEALFDLMEKSFQSGYAAQMGVEKTTS